MATPTATQGNRGVSKVSPTRRKKVQGKKKKAAKKTKKWSKGY